jgi:hypothetical protein
MPVLLKYQKRVGIICHLFDPTLKALKALLPDDNRALRFATLYAFRSCAVIDVNGNPWGGSPSYSAFIGPVFLAPLHSIFISYSDT